MVAAGVLVLFLWTLCFLTVVVVAGASFDGVDAAGAGVVLVCANIAVAANIEVKIIFFIVSFSFFFGFLALRTHHAADTRF